MGKNKKRFNWKARQKNEGSVDNSQVKLLSSKVDMAKMVGQEITNEKKGYDDSNALVLPSDKRIFKQSKGPEPIGKLLSKRRRKHLEKVVEKKKKKAERNDLLQKLESVRARDGELAKLTSLSDVQTRGLKRHFAEDGWREMMEKSGQIIEVVPVQAQTPEEGEESKPKKVKLKAAAKKTKTSETSNSDPNILGFP